MAFPYGRDDDCSVAIVDGDPGVSFMVEHGIITRVDVADAHHLTASGARVGETEADIRSLYGARLEVSPHAYTGGHYLTVRSADRSSALVFETDGSRVTLIRAGRLPSAEYVEGCS